MTNDHPARDAKGEATGRDLSQPNPKIGCSIRGDECEFQGPHLHSSRGPVSYRDAVANAGSPRPSTRVDDGGVPVGPTFQPSTPTECGICDYGIPSNCTCPKPSTPTVLSEVLAERERQNEKWGEQNHEAPFWMLILGEEYGEAQKAILDSFTTLPTSAKPFLSDYRSELIQVAAVAVAAVESLDRNGR